MRMDKPDTVKHQPGRGRGARRVFTFWTTLFLLTSLAMSLLLLGGAAMAAPSAIANPETWVTDGVVLSIARAGDTTYLGGVFTSVGPPSGQGVPLDPGTAQPVPDYPKVSGDVAVAIPDGSGGLYIGGKFTGVGGVARNNIAHILSDSTVDPSWNPDVPGTYATVSSLAVADSTVYVGGSFSTIQGSSGGPYTRNNLAAIDATSGNPTAWDPNVNGNVSTLTVSGSTVYTGGSFTSIAGSSGGPYLRNSIAAIDATSGNPTSWDPNINNGVSTLAVSGSTVYVGGMFTTIQGSSGGPYTRNKLAAIDATSANPTSWDPNVNGFSVFTLTVSGPTVYVGGWFSSIQGSSGGPYTRNNLAAIDATSGNPTAWDPNVNGSVSALTVSGPTVYVGGRFTTIQGSSGGPYSRNNMAAIDATSANPTSWDPNPNEGIATVTVSGSAVYIGGTFTSMGTEWVLRNNIAALDDVTGAATSWNPDVNNRVLSVAVSGSKVYAGGWFTTIQGSSGGPYTRNHIAAIDATSANPTSWDPNANGNVYALALSGSTVYAGGSFTSLQGSSAGPYTRNSIAAIDATSANPTTWNPNANSQVSALALSGSNVYIGGYFTTIQGSSGGPYTRNRIAAIDATSANPTIWNPNVGGGVSALAVSGSNVYAGGAFTTIQGSSGGPYTRNRIAAIDATSANPTTWAPNLDNQVLALAVSGSIIYAGGDFTSIQGSSGGPYSRNRIAAIDATSANPTTWDPGASTSVYSLSYNGTSLHAGGFFKSMGTQCCTYYARFDSAPTVTSITPGSSGLGATVSITDLAGTGFRDGANVALEKDAQVIPGTGVAVVSSTKITCSFAIPSDADIGGWDVNVENPDAQAGTLDGGFAVVIRPTLTTNAATSVTQTGVILNGNITATGGGNAQGRGFQWRKKGAGSWTDWKQTGSFETGAFSYPVTGLARGTTYEFRAQAQNAAGTSTGNTVSFTTQAEPAGSSTWYLAEGTTAWGFSTYISIQNPNSSAVSAKVTLMPKGGSSVEEVLTLPASSQTTLASDHLLEKLGGEKDFSTKVEATDPGKSIAVDRTMEWTGQGASAPEGHSSVGVTSPALEWYLPEGSTNWGFETWLLIQNPNASEASCRVTYMVEGKGAQEVTHKVPANSRESFSMQNDIGQADASIKVSSDKPVIPERAMYRNNRREGHDSIGTTTPAEDFYLAEGAVGYDSGYTTYVLVQNPQNTTNDITITYLTGAGQVAGPTFTMEPNSRKTVKVNDSLPPNTDVSTSVHGSKPVIAERAMYWSSTAGEACHDSVGMSEPAMTFYLPDGQTSEGRETWTLVQNPNPGSVTVKITYLASGGGVPVSFTEEIAANSRKSYSMADKVTSGRASIMVQSLDGARPIMCERAMYWANRNAGTDTIGGAE